MFRLSSSCLAALVIATWLPACATDNAAAGPALAQTGDGGNQTDGGSIGDATGQDTGSTGNDGITVVPNPDGGPLQTDVAVGPDGGPIGGTDGGPGPGGSCEGICGKFIKGAACHCDNKCQQYGDCCGDYQALCGVGPGKSCGDGTCDATETTQSCPQDCPPDPAEILSCIADKCPAEMKNCQADKVCAKVIGCIQQCKDQKCIDGCTQGLDLQQVQASLAPIGACAEKVGCVTGGPPQGCGDGQCGPGETSNSCPQDCGPPTKKYCGDGTCDNTESAASCPADCKGPGPGPIGQCLMTKCKDTFNACSSNPGCQKVLDCGSQCADLGCLTKCAQLVDPGTQQKYVLPLGQCGQNAGCFDGSTTPVPVCGDGKCDTGENASNCAKDCATASNPVEQCLAANCAKSWTPCAASKECYAAAQCLEKGGSIFQCVKSFQVGQQVNAVVQCGNQYKCLTGGTTTGGSCQGKCGQYDPKASCQCDSVCKKMGNCCKDIDTVCPVAPPAKCGDGVCDLASGEAKTCPVDCGPVVTKCATKSDCGSDEVCCAQVSGQVCVKIGQCN
jgi:hypothetical protein